MTMARHEGSPWWLRPLLLGATPVAVMMLSPMPVAADENPTITVTPGELKFEMGRSTDPAVVQLVITTTSAETLNITPWVVLDHGSSDCGGNSVSLRPTQPAVEPKGSKAQAFQVSFPQGCAERSGTLILTEPSGHSTTVRFSAAREFSDEQLWFPIYAAGIAGLLFGVVAWLCGLGGLTQEVHAGSSWSFKDSWVTNIAAIGGVLTTVLAATGFLESIIPGMATGRLLGLNIIFTATILASPLVYSAFSSWKTGPAGELAAKGVGWGVVAASTVTVIGVVGQLGTLWLLNSVADGDNGVRNFIFICLVAAALLVIVYGARFVYGITRPANVTSLVNQPHLSGTM